MTNEKLRMTLCRNCVDALAEAGQTIKRVDMSQRIMEPCFICGYKGFDYFVEDEVKDGRSIRQENI